MTGNLHHGKAVGTGIRRSWVALARPAERGHPSSAGSPKVWQWRREGPPAGPLRHQWDPSRSMPCWGDQQCRSSIRAGKSQGSACRVRTDECRHTTGWTSEGTSYARPSAAPRTTHRPRLPDGGDLDVGAKRSKIRERLDRGQGGTGHACTSAHTSARALKTNARDVTDTGLAHRPVAHGLAPAPASTTGQPGHPEATGSPSCWIEPRRASRGTAGMLTDQAAASSRRCWRWPARTPRVGSRRGCDWRGPRAGFRSSRPVP